MALCNVMEWMPMPVRAYPFGTWLRKTRKVKEMTQEELARRSGYSATYISNLERGFVSSESDATPRPSPEAIDAIAGALAANREEHRAFIMEARRLAGYATESNELTDVDFDTLRREVRVRRGGVLVKADADSLSQLLLQWRQETADHFRKLDLLLLAAAEALHESRRQE